MSSQHSPSTTSAFGVVLLLMRRTLSRPAWLMALFLLLACLIPFAGGTSPFRSDPAKILDPFGFSLLTPSKHAFGPAEMETLAILLIVPLMLIDIRGFLNVSQGIPWTNLVPRWVIPLTALCFYALFLLMSLPLLARSSFFPGPISLAVEVIDLLLLATTMAWVVDFSMTRIANLNLRPLLGLMVAGALHLGISISDAYIVAPQASDLVEVSWTQPAWHALLAIVAVTVCGI